MRVVGVRARDRREALEGIDVVGKPRFGMYAFVGCQNGCRRTPSFAEPTCPSTSASAAAKDSQEEESYIAPSVIPIRFE